MVEELEEIERRIGEKIKKDDDADSGTETESDIDTDSGRSTKTIIFKE